MTAVRVSVEAVEVQGFPRSGLLVGAMGSRLCGRGEAVQERLPLSEVWKSWKDCAHVEASVLAR